MKKLALLAVLLAAALSSAQAAVYDIDPTQSYVKAYMPLWQRVKGAGGATVLIPDPAGNLPEPTYHWELSWLLQSYSLSGSFEMTRVPHASQEERARLYVSDQSKVVTNAPGYVGFHLPSFFAESGGSIKYIGGPCFDATFYDGPGWTTYCSGWTTGPVRNDEGIRMGGEISIQGVNPGSPMLTNTLFNAPDGLEPPAADLRAVQDVFEYRLVAVSAVPETDVASLMLAGIALLAWRRGRTRGST